MIIYLNYGYKIGAEEYIHSRYTEKCKKETKRRVYYIFGCNGNYSGNNRNSGEYVKYNVVKVHTVLFFILFRIVFFLFISFFGCFRLFSGFLFRSRFSFCFCRCFFLRFFFRLENIEGFFLLCSFFRS